MSLLLSLNYNYHNIAKVVILEVTEDRPESFKLHRVWAQPKEAELPL